MSKLSLETIMQETIWVGKFYHGGRISGTKRDIGHIDDSEFRDLDIACTENQPEYLREFYRGYFDQSKYYLIQDYYNNVYAKGAVYEYEVSYINHGIGQSNIYIAESEDQIRSDFEENRPLCELVGIRKTTYVKPGQPVINLTLGGK